MGKRLNIELGQRVVNSGQKFSSRVKKPAKTVLYSLLFAISLLRKLTIRVLSREQARGQFDFAWPPYRSRKSCLGKHFRHSLVETKGLEPSTPALQRQCSPN